ncbi:MAG TPA: SDR family NAD(P)-dependent oxidoreductase [Planctomycetota bacterium]|nr:SDR family NAD(P)-dependent oxidoreductase [Planctomycetota bacterium]
MTDSRQSPTSRARATALVTGASSGIGAALAAGLAAAGHAVVLAARDKEQLERVAERIRQQGGEAIAIRCDVTDRASVEQLVVAAIAAFGRLDVVVANAGAYQRKPATELTRADFDAAFAVNLFGVVHLVEAVLPRLLAHGAGHLVFVTSFDARKPMPHDGAYAAAKAAVAAYVAALRQGLHGRGVRVCTVYPGRVDTRMIAQLRVPAISAKIPPARVAKAILRAIRRGSPEVVVPWHCRLLLWADTLSPRLGDWLVRVLRLDGREQLS